MAAKWTISFYNGKVENKNLSFPPGILANLIHILELIEMFGPNLGKPHTSSMGKGLFEIRAKGKEGIGRSFFCTIKGQEIIILHSIVKKTRKTPKKYLELALRRMKEVKGDRK
ncbi:MAG: type II toxin-antitoxin system RelE/ParE family toxin [Desulfobacterales bacterium]|nr:type II toxin-antitoxin system RelE/ParE family toxin [Desulfobacterales bacterium]